MHSRFPSSIHSRIRTLLAISATALLMNGPAYAHEGRAADAREHVEAGQRPLVIGHRARLAICQSTRWKAMPWPLNWAPTSLSLIWSSPGMGF